ncbi:MAG: hypothetical protein H7330_17420 [Hymenobacteraceae bacterium]|nr:hypothetical protein [Hymenobacteraceae bacterium]
MKKLLFSLATAGTLLLSGCDPKAETTTSDATQASETAAPVDNTTTVTPADTARAPKAPAYECPMKCEGSASDKPGKCPTCGMELVKNG